MKLSKTRARRGWFIPDSSGGLFSRKKLAGYTEPVALISLADLEALEEHVAETLANRYGYTVKGEPAVIFRNNAAAVLCALGLHRNRKS